VNAINTNAINVIVIISSPNKEGLTAACAIAAAEGARMASGIVEQVWLNDLEIGLCQACNDGWGTCRTEHRCQVEDDFQALHRRICQADAYVLATPVYFGEMSESAKAFTDRLRRCEATRDEDDQEGMLGKPFIALAAAGDSGEGTVTCLLSIERWIYHVRAQTFNLIPVNRWSREYKLVAIQETARAMVQEAMM